MGGADGIDAGDEPVAFDFFEGQVEFEDVGIGLAGETGQGGEMRGRVRPGVRERHGHVVEGDRAVQPGAGREEALLQILAAFDRIAQAGDAFGVDEDLGGEKGDGLVDGGDAGEVPAGGENG